MYLEHFGLREHPFKLTPDSEFLFMSEGHARAKAYMDYTIWNRDGFVVVTGEVGAGKTTLLQKLLSEFDENVVVAKIFQTQLTEVELLQAILVEFGMNPFSAKKVELMDMLTTFLIDQFLSGKQLVLIVDEAQNLGRRALEEIRMLSSLETQKEKVLHVILVGQPELNEVLDTAEMEQLLQRVRLRCHIGALSETDTMDYIRYRLGVAGYSGADLFAPDTMALIYQYTGGIPRLINTMCDIALTVAFSDGAHVVDCARIEAAVGELQWVTYPERRKVVRGRRNEDRGNGADLQQYMQQTTDYLASISGTLRQLEALPAALASIAEGLRSLDVRLEHERTVGSEGSDERAGTHRVRKGR